MNIEEPTYDLWDAISNATEDTKKKIIIFQGKRAGLQDDQIEAFVHYLFAFSNLTVGNGVSWLVRILLRMS